MKQYFNFSWCLLLCFICAANSSKAQTVKVSAKLDRSVIALGDQTVLRLSANLPVKGQVSFPNLSDTISSKIQIVEIGKTDTIADKSNPGNQIISKAYTITSFDAGLQVIPSFVFESGTEKLNTASLPLQVNEVKVDTTKAIYDIKQPLAISYSFMDWLRDNGKWIGFAVLAILLLASAWYYFRKMRKPKAAPAEPAKPAIPAHKLALDKLHELAKKKLWQQELVKEYHSELSDIIREYLEKRYQIKAMEQTSEEIFAGLKHIDIKEQNRNALRQILLLADLAKFAKSRPLNTENEQSMENALSFVSETREINQLPNNKQQSPNESV